MARERLIEADAAISRHQDDETRKVRALLARLAKLVERRGVDGALDAMRRSLP